MPRVHRFVTNDLTVRAAAVDATEVVKEMQKLHNAFPVAAMGVGKAMVGALLLASQLKDNQQVGLLFRGNGGLKSIYAEAGFEGKVRAYTPNPQFEPVSYKGGVKVGEALGSGTLTVARHQPFQKQPFQGTVELVTGEIAEDLAHYLHQSHQIRSIVSLGIYLSENGQVQKAGGVIVEVMPGVEDVVVEQLQKNVESQQPSISKLLMSGGSAIDLIKPYLDGMIYTELDHPHEVNYFCPCTKDRVSAALEVLTNEDLLDMIDKQENPEVTCQMCGKPYLFQNDEIVEIQKRRYRNSLN